MILRQAVLSDVGRIRKKNEDAYGSAVADDGTHLVCVADGMGGHEAGEVASWAAVQAVMAGWAPTGGDPIPTRLQRCVNAANNQVLAAAVERGLGLGDTGTTLVMLTIHRGVAHIAWVGDSRAYLLRAGRLTQLTVDHTETQELIAIGQLDPGADGGRHDHVLTRCLGFEPEVRADFCRPLPVQLDDIFLLCSDGLTGEVAESDISQIMQYHDLGEAADALIETANHRDGSDNTTVLLVRCGQRVAPLTPKPSGYRLPAAAARRRRLVALTALLILGLVVALVWLIMPAA